MKCRLSVVQVPSVTALALFACIIAAGTPTVLPAEELHCQMCAPVPGIGGIAGIEDGHLFGGGGSILRDCHALNACHENWQRDTCTF